jgi:serine/threonine protein kinase
MNFPKSIYERCVLHDIFTEITCLENFRLDDRITKMYNYGVVDNTYVIVMKKYNCSLREWVLRHKNELWTHLNTILTIYYDVLKIVKTLHDQKVTHYDIKADNILLEIDPDD